MPPHIPLRVRIPFVLLTLSLLLGSAACKSSAPVCPEDSITYSTDVTQLRDASLEREGNRPQAPTQVEVNGKMILVDQVVSGNICSGTWSGTVYVACSLHIAAWEDVPNFLEGCSLVIESGSVIYVAAHNDTPYYQGCSCHTGEVAVE